MAVDNMKKKAKRKPGGGRKKSKPDYNPSAIIQNQMDAAVALYDKEEHPSLQTIADELDLNPIKVRKLLITAGVYKSDAADQVQRVFMHRYPPMQQGQSECSSVGTIEGFPMECQRHLLQGACKNTL